MEIKDIVKINRKKNRLTLKELSVQSGISLPFISDIERGRRVPSIEKAKKIAAILNIDFKLLLNDKISSLLNEITADIDVITNSNVKCFLQW